MTKTVDEFRTKQDDPLDTSSHLNRSVRQPVIHIPIYLHNYPMPHPTWRESRLTCLIRYRGVLSKVALIPSPAIIVLQKIVALRVQDILIASWALLELVDRHPDPMPSAKQPIVRPVQDNTLYIVRVAEVQHVGAASEVLDILANDSGALVSIPLRRRGRCLEVGRAFRGAGL
jgi:hypothetical protein